MKKHMKVVKNVKHVFQANSMDKEYQKKVDSLHLAVFGDDETGTVGMLDKTNAMYDILTKGKTGVSFIGWTIVSIITLGLFFGTIKGWLIALAHYILTAK